MRAFGSHERPQTSRQIALGGVLMFAMLIGSFPQYSLGVLGPVLVTDLSLTEFEFGLIASALYVSAALVARFSGGQLDRMHGRVSLGLLYLTSAGSGFALANSSSRLGAAAAVALAGVAIGANNLVTNRLIALHVPAGRRGSIIGIKQVGVKAAQLTAGVVVPLFVLTIGWRDGLRLFALLGLVVALASLGLVPPERGPSAFGPRRATGDDSYRRQVRWLQYYATLMAMGMAAVTTYLPLHAVRAVGMSLTEGGLLVTLFGGVGVVARLVWANLADRSGRPARVLILLSFTGAVSLAATAATATLGRVSLWFTAVVAGASVGSWNVVAHLTVVNEIRHERSASATGLVQATFLLGLAAGAPAFGVVVAITGSFSAAWCLTALAACGAGWVAVKEQRRRRVTSVSTAGPPQTP